MVERINGQVSEALIIHNSFAGTKDKSREVNKAAELLASRIRRVEILRTEGPGHATELALEAIRAGYLHIVVAGGDGTLREVAAGAVNSNVDITLWPTGSEEMARRDLKMPRNLLRAVDIVTNGKVQAIDTGTMNGEIFLFNAGIGADADVVYGVQKPGCKKDGYGTMAYLRQAAKILPRVRGVAAELIIDGERFLTDKFYQAWINNGRRLARFPVTKGKIDDEGKVELILAFAYRMSELVFPGAVAFAAKQSNNHFSFTAVSSMDVNLSRLRRYQNDGDPSNLVDHVEMRTNPGSLRMRVPDRENVIYSRPPIRR